MSCKFLSISEYFQKTRISFSFAEGSMKETLCDEKYSLTKASGTEPCLKRVRVSAVC